MKLPDELQPYREPLEAVQNLISRFNHQGVVIGGIAVSVLGRARFTADIDAMFLLSIDDIPRFLEEAKLEGIEPRVANAAEFARQSRVLLLRHVPTDTEIDISLGILPFEQEMVERSAVQEFDDTLSVRLPTPEDLIVMKAIAHRSQDMADIRTLAAKYPNLDISRIKRWITDYAELLYAPDLWDEIKQILKPPK